MRDVAGKKERNKEKEMREIEGNKRGIERKNERYSGKKERNKEKEMRDREKKERDY